MKTELAQVAERALFIWNNDDIVKLINQSRLTLSARWGVERDVAGRAIALF